MANAGGLLLVLVAGLVALVFSGGTIAAVIYALVAKNAKRGLGFGIAAIVVTLVSMLLSLPFWILFIRGSGSHGAPVTLSDDWPFAVPIVLEVLSLAGAIAGTVRQATRL